MLRVNGGEKTGSGTILRLSVALSAILGEELYIYNIRGKRKPPGLKPQHLESVLTAGKICNAEIKNAKIGSQELWFKPDAISGGEFTAEIRTAGSIPMLILTILPLCIFTKHSVRVTIKKGGTDVRNSPTINYLQHILLPSLTKMGIRSSLDIHAYGYFPVGMGEVSLSVQPCTRLAPLILEKFGKLGTVRGISVCTFLKNKRVAERQARSAEEFLRKKGYSADIDVYYDISNPQQKGSTITLYSITDTGVILGSDSIGEVRKPSEKVGYEAAENLYLELKTSPTADIHLADMLIPYVALADSGSKYFTRSLTGHLETNIWLTEKILKTKFQVKKVGNLFEIIRD
jgi:RNA 3'-terminal phosphate cyclase (ATP)